MPTPLPQWSAHDICSTGFVPTLCTGEADPDQEPIPHCSLTAVRWIPRVTAEVIDEDPSGQAGVNCAFRRTPPQSNGGSVEFDACSRENPLLWAMLGQAQVIFDPDNPEQVRGVEEVTDDAVSCGSCAIASTQCAHKVALVVISNAICGSEGEHHPDFPYVARIFPSLTFEPSTQTSTRSRGFNTRTFSSIARSNELFADPWGIDPRGAGSKARWRDILIPTASVVNNVGDIASLINGCDCGRCPA